VAEVVVQKTTQEVLHNHYQLKVDLVVEVMDRLMTLELPHKLELQIPVVAVEVVLLLLVEALELVVQE
jgi:hypothetical protein